MRTLIAAAILLALAGCSAAPPSKSYLLLSDKMEETGQLALYREDIGGSIAARLDGKVNLRETYYRSEQPCDRIRAGGDDLPTREESDALRYWAAVRAAYFERFHSLELQSGDPSDKVAPLAARYVEALRDDLDYSTMLINDLAAGKMTYCDFAKRQKAAILASHDRVTPLRKQMVAAMRDEGYARPGSSALSAGGSVIGITAGSNGPAGSVGH